MECSARCLTIVYPLDGDITWPDHQTAQLLNSLLSFSYEMDLFLYELMPVQCLCCVWVWEAVAETPQSMFSQSSSQVRQLIIGPTAGAEERASKYFWGHWNIFLPPVSASPGEWRCWQPAPDTASCSSQQGSTHIRNNGQIVRLHILHWSMGEWWIKH